MKKFHRFLSNFKNGLSRVCRGLMLYEEAVIGICQVVVQELIRGSKNSSRNNFSQRFSFLTTLPRNLGYTGGPSR
jgi:hypothetical protein